MTIQLPRGRLIQLSSLSLLTIFSRTLMPTIGSFLLSCRNLLTYVLFLPTLSLVGHVFSFAFLVLLPHLIQQLFYFDMHQLECWAGLLGSVAPCVLYGSNVERLGPSPGTFSNHCLPYTGLYLMGNTFFGWNCLAPWFSYPIRTAIRRKFNLEGSGEALARACGCCASFVEDEVQREQCETACDFATHVFCHACALCQEGREIRRRLPHPGFNAQPFVVMTPPGEQTMGRRA